MSDAKADSRRQTLRVVAVVALLAGLGSVGQAVWHLIIRDEMWGLAVAWKGGSGALLLWLSSWFRRRAERHR